MTEPVGYPSEQGTGPADVLRTLRWAILLVSLPFSVLRFVLPLRGAELGAPAVQIGVMLSSFSVVTVLGRPLVGWALDRYGRRRFFLAGVFGYALTMTLFVLLPSVTGIIVARAVQGVASSMLWLSLRAMVADVASDTERATVFGRLDAASSQGMTVGAVLGFGLLQVLSLSRTWKLTMGASAAAAAVALALSWRNLPETMRAADRPSARKERAWRDLATRPFVSLLALAFVAALSGALVAPLVIVHLQSRGIAAERIIWAYVPQGLVWATLPAHLGRLSDRFGRIPLMALALLVSGVATLGIPYAAGLWVIAGLWGMEAVAQAAGGPAQSALISDMIGRDRRGRAFGAYMTVAGLGSATGPLLGGWLYDSVTPQTPFVINAVVLAACGLTVMIAGKALFAVARGESRPGRA